VTVFFAASLTVYVHVTPFVVTVSANIESAQAQHAIAPIAAVKFLVFIFVPFHGIH
jgi:hypothetical protein